MTFEKRRYEAAKYLLLKDKELSESSLDCFENEKIFFNRLCRQSLTSESYASLQAAKEDADNGALSRRCGLCGKKGNRAYRVRIQTSNSPIRR